MFGMHFFSLNDLSFVLRNTCKVYDSYETFAENVFWRQLTEMSERSANKISLLKGLDIRNEKTNVEGNKGSHLSHFPLQRLLICIAGKGEFVLRIASHS